MATVPGSGVSPIIPAADAMSPPNSVASKASLPRPPAKGTPFSPLPMSESWHAAQVIVISFMYLPVDLSCPMTSPSGSWPEPPPVVLGSWPGSGYGLRNGAS